MRSLFAEQIVRENLGAYFARRGRAVASRGAPAFVLSPRAFALSPDDYLEQLAALKDALGIPVIASLNGAEPGPWLEYAPLLEAVGADAIELNLQPGGAEVTRSSADIEAALLETVRAGARGGEHPGGGQAPALLQRARRCSRRRCRRRARAPSSSSAAPQPPDIDPATLAPVPPLAALAHDRAPAAAALAGHPVLPAAHPPGRHGRRARRDGGHQGADGRGRRRADGLRDPGPRPAPPARGARGDGGVDGRGTATNRSARLRGSMDLEACPDPAAYERATDILALQRWPG